MKHNITTVITYCSIDHQFFKECLEAVLPFSNNVVISIGTTLWQGAAEDPLKLEQVQTITDGYDNVHVSFYDPSKAFENHHLFRSHHTSLLYILDNDLEPDYVLILDCDEIVDTARMISYLDEGFYGGYDSIRFAARWYFRDKKYRAIQDHETAGTLYNFLTYSQLFRQNRKPVWWGLPNVGRQICPAKASDGCKIVHHYSWVRDKEQMLAKAENFGHRDDYDWTKLIEAEFEHDFSGSDFLPDHKYKYEEKE